MATPVAVHNTTGADDPDIPVLSPDSLRALTHEILDLSTADFMYVTIYHTAIGMARVSLGHVRMQDNGDKIFVNMLTRFGQRIETSMSVNQIDHKSIRQTVHYLDRLARETAGDPVSLVTAIPPRHYLANTAWQATTADAFAEARHGAVAKLVTPLLDAGLVTSAMVGVYARSRVHAGKDGLIAAGRETDAEVVATGWNPVENGRVSGSGWAGQAARDWRTIDPASVAARAIELTRRSLHPVAFEPGRRVAILDRPAVAQLVRAMGMAFDAKSTFNGQTPLYDKRTHKPTLGQRVMDPRISLMSDPNDPDGGFLPFNWQAYPLIPMTWIDHGVHTNLAYDVGYAAEVGYTPANDAPGSLRMSNVSTGEPTTIDEMIAECKSGVYVNRFSHVESVPNDDPTVAMYTGVTSGGCFLVRDGKIEKPIKDLRFLESPWFFLNRLIAIGKSERAPFGYAPWAGDWPVDPTIVPPIMVSDFNFNALSDAI